ncbi:MAG: hypothetical protein M0D55_12475 [Elusimicrobiota bacterium]|nr:MAG: hypothetical protein M0D55_12475 [Elusimicrobiota bacterium]
MRLTFLAPCAVFLSALAGAQPVERPTTSGNTNTGGPTGAVGSILGNPSSPIGGAALTPGLGLTPSLSGATPAPNVISPAGALPVNGAVPVQVQGVIPAAPVGAGPAKAAPVRTAPKAAAVPAAANPSADASIPAGRDGAPAATASSMLDETARGISKGRDSEAAGAGDGLSVRRALDRAYDSAAGTGDVSSSAGASGVAGRFTTAREKIAGLVGVANNAAPADAPGLYRSALEAAKEALPAAAAEAVSNAVRGFARRKADVSLSELAQSAYAAASAGQSAETKRLVKSLDSWQELLGAPGRPLISNGDRLKAGVERALADATKPGAARGSAPRVWVVKRDGTYAAALPGSAVEKIPSLGASFALKAEALLPSPLAAAYARFAAKPGLRSAIAARAEAAGETWLTAATGTLWSWLKMQAARAWNGLLSLLPGRSLPSVADAKTTLRLRAAAAAWREATASGEAAARAAGAPRPTVARARAAFALAAKAAAAHETFTGSPAQPRESRGCRRPSRPPSRSPA